MDFRIWDLARRVDTERVVRVVGIWTSGPSESMTAQTLYMVEDFVDGHKTMLSAADLIAAPAAPPVGEETGGTR